MFTKRNFVKFVGFGCRTSRCGSAILVGLHLRQAKGKVGHGGQFFARSSNVFVPTKGSVNTKSLRIKHAFHSIGFGNVSKGTIFNFASFSVPAKWHFRQVVLMQKFAGRSLHAQISQPVTTHDGT
eukprot:scaffold2033_cov164-Amphora_coffeaeformis.AAC.20